MLLLSSDLSHVNPDLLHSLSLYEGGLLPPVTILSFCFCMNDHVVPTDGANCWWYFWTDDMAWSETSFLPRVGLQNRKDPPGVGRRSLLQRSSQSSIYVKRGDREISENNENYPLIIFILPFYTPMCYMSLLPLSSARLHVDVLNLLWLDLTGLINTKGCSWSRLKIQRPNRSPKSEVWDSIIKANLAPHW